MNHYQPIKKLSIVQPSGLKLTLPEEEQTLEGNLLCKYLNDMTVEDENAEAAISAHMIYMYHC